MIIMHCRRGRTFSTAFCACQRCRLQRKIVNDSFNGFNESTICLFSVLNDANVQTKVLERVGTVIQLKRFQMRQYHTSTVTGCMHHTVPWCEKTCCSIMLRSFLLDVSVLAASRCFCSCSCSCCFRSPSHPFSGAGGAS